MMARPKVAFYWCASCGGCEEAVVDLEERILDVAAAVDIVLWPVALDFKYKDVEAMEDGAIAVSFINGAIRTGEQESVARLLRKKSGLVVAFGSCAVMGGIPALANLTSREKIFDSSYRSSPSVDNPGGVEPKTDTELDGHSLELPEFYDTVYKLDDVVDVDYYLPGCAPTPDLVAAAVTAILKGELPEKGAVLSPNRALCRSCDRNDTKPDDVCIDKVVRVTDIMVDEKTCFLAQGLLCMGPATRDGCGCSCIKGNMPCTGCFGPTDNCRDQGAKMVATLGGLLSGDDSESVEKVLDGIVDPAGSFYRYGMSASLAGSRRKE
jgi:F420-non-reducing hydrogenase small subunit